jgi:hypothetical protein
MFIFLKPNYLLVVCNGTVAILHSTLKNDLIYFFRNVYVSYRNVVFSYRNRHFFSNVVVSYYDFLVRTHELYHDIHQLQCVNECDLAVAQILFYHFHSIQITCPPYGG